MPELIQVKDPSCILVKTIAHPIVTVTRKMGIAVKNFHAAEMKHYFAKVSCSHTWSRGLRFRLVIYHLSAL